jgi:hypothetical protein
MRRNGVVCWIAAVGVTLVSAVYQRVSGPTYPVRGRVVLGDREIVLRLERSHGGPGDQPVRIKAVDPAVAGDLLWRRFPSADPWRVVSMAREGEWLTAALPHQPPAGKLEYQVQLERAGEKALFPARPVVTRFKGGVSPWVLVPHILAMFAGMLMSNRAGLEAAVDGTSQRRYTLWAVSLIVVGGFLLGPAVQKAAFGSWWTGIPFGWDLTDNKTLFAGAAWLWATWRVRRGRTARSAIVAAALVTLAVFAIPHSVWGSELR